MTSSGERTGAPTLIQLAAFEGPERTSFVRMLEAVLVAARGRGWRTTVVLPAVSAGSAWAQECGRATRCWLRPRRSASNGSRSPSAAPVVRWSSTPTSPSSTSPRRATCARADAAAVWHFHTVLERTSAALARHVAKLALSAAIRRPPSSPLRCDRTALPRRGAPRKRVHTPRTPIDASSFPLLDADARAQARERFGPLDRCARPGSLRLGLAGQGGDRLLATIAALRRRDRREGAHAGRSRGHRGGGASGPERSGRCPARARRGCFRALRRRGCPARDQPAGRGDSFTVLESLCLGTPVVATDIPWHRPVVRPPSASWSRRGDRLADGVAETLGRAPVKAEGEAVASRNRVMRRFSLEEYARRLLELYGAVLGETAPGRTNVQYAERRQ